MGFSKLTPPLLIYPPFIAASLLVGWFLPDFYEWTDSDQSRPSPLLWRVPIWSAIASIAFCVVLPWLPLKINPSHDELRTPMRFGLRYLLMVTAGVAVSIALLAKFPLFGGGVFGALAFAYFIRFMVRYSQYRMASATLFACMILPFSWVVGYDELDRLLPTLAIMISGLPALVPAMLISGMIGQHFQDSFWLAILLTAIELVIGIWVIRLGPKRTIVYLLLVMQMSSLGSLVFYQICIA